MMDPQEPAFEVLPVLVRQSEYRKHSMTARQGVEVIQPIGRIIGVRHAAKVALAPVGNPTADAEPAAGAEGQAVRHPGRPMIQRAPGGLNRKATQREMLMGIVRVHTTMSLDGYIAGPGGDMDWVFEHGSDVP